MEFNERPGYLGRLKYLLRRLQRPCCCCYHHRCHYLGKKKFLARSIWFFDDTLPGLCGGSGQVCRRQRHFFSARNRRLLATCVRVFRRLLRYNRRACDVRTVHRSCFDLRLPGGFSELHSIHTLFRGYRHFTASLRITTSVLTSILFSSIARSRHANRCTQPASPLALAPPPR